MGVVESAAKDKGSTAASRKVAAVAAVLALGALVTLTFATF